MGKHKYLLNNIGVLALSQFSTKILSFFLFLCLFYLPEEIKNEGRERLYLSLACATLIICLVTFLTCPSRQTVYQMIIADGLTSEDLEQGFDHSKEVIDYIIEVTNTKEGE